MPIEFNKDKTPNQDPVKPKLFSLLIEAVDNGFIVHENKGADYLRNEASLNNRKVFNTKDQLNEFINKSF